MNKHDYIARPQVAVSQLHNCGAVWRESVPVREVFQRKTLWNGDVEVFELKGHPKLILRENDFMLPSAFL